MSRFSTTTTTKETTHFEIRVFAVSKDTEYDNGAGRRELLEDHSAGRIATASDIAAALNADREMRAVVMGLLE